MLSDPIFTGKLVRESHFHTILPVSVCISGEIRTKPLPNKVLVVMISVL